MPFCIRSTWKIPTSVTLPGSVDGRFYISRRASCFTNIAERSARSFPSIHRIHPEEELRSVLLEECPRMAEALSHFGASWADAVVSSVIGDSPERTNLAGLWRALLQLPRAVRARWRARQLAAIRTRKHSAARSAATSATGSHAFLFARKALRSLRLAVPDLPSDSRRRSLYVSNGDRARTTDGPASDRASRF